MWKSFPPNKFCWVRLKSLWLTFKKIKDRSMCDEGETVRLQWWWTWLIRGIPPVSDRTSAEEFFIQRNWGHPFIFQREKDDKDKKKSQGTAGLGGGRDSGWKRTRVLKMMESVHQRWIFVSSFRNFLKFSDPFSSSKKQTKTRIKANRQVNIGHMLVQNGVIIHTAMNSTFPSSLSTVQSVVLEWR